MAIEEKLIVNKLLLKGKLIMTRELGQLGEELAVDLLKAKGYIILERNFRCKLGEIDIIARDKDTLVFLEVRSKSSSGFGVPQESVNYKKQRTIRRVAEYYLIKNKLQNDFCRFDVIAVTWQNNSTPKIEIIKDAF